MSSIIISAAVIILLVVACGFSIRSFLSVNIQGQKALDSIEESVNQLFTSLIDQETGERGYNLTNDPVFLEPYTKGLEEFSSTSKELSQSTKKFPELSEDVESVIEKGLFWQDHFGKPLVDLTLRGEKPDLERLRDGKRAIDEFREATGDFIEKIEQQRSVVRNTMQFRINSALAALVISLISIILTNLWINFRVLKSIIKPIIELSTCVKYYTEHDFSIGRPSYDKKDELSELIRNIDIMRKELSASISTLESKVNFDELTGLYNRRFFNEVMKKEWEEAGAASNELSLILFDIDHYKQYNDTYGHLMGDDCLKIISKCLQAYNLDPRNYAARYGGEEFALLLLGRTQEEAFQIAEDVRKQIMDLKIPHKSSPTSEYVTVSIGVATMVPDGGKMPNEIISQADDALYQSKQNSRNLVTLYS